MSTRKSNYLGSALLAATTLVVAACSGGSGDGRYGAPSPAPAPQNTAPSIGAISDLTADQDTVITFDVAVSDAETSAGMLAVTAKADGATLFPADDGVVLAGSGATRTLTLTPLEAQTGTATVTVTATDAGGLSTSRSFNVSVNAKYASAWQTMAATLRKGANDEPTQLNGLTFQQDATEADVAPYLPAPEPLAGID
jgi:hypothetical protein